jgi:hypothetical protein
MPIRAPNDELGGSAVIGVDVAADVNDEDQTGFV